MYKTTLKSSLIIHNETCKTRIDKIQEENEQKKDNEILELKKNIEKLKNELYILMSDTYPERERKLKEEINEYKTEIRVKDEQIKMKDELNQELKKEIEYLKIKVDNTYNTLIDRSDKTYNTFFEKEEKLVDTLLQHNNSMSKNSGYNKSISNNLTINNYGIKPLTTDSIIGAFDSYHSKNKNAFNGYVYDMITGDYVSFKVEHIFYGIIKELKDY
jgi:chromosome segregation ATPase